MSDNNWLSTIKALIVKDSYSESNDVSVSSEEYSKEDNSYYSASFIDTLKKKTPTDFLNANNIPNWEEYSQAYKQQSQISENSLQIGWMQSAQGGLGGIGVWSSITGTDPYGGYSGIGGLGSNGIGYSGGKTGIDSTKDYMPINKDYYSLPASVMVYFRKCAKKRPNIVIQKISYNSYDDFTQSEVITVSCITCGKYTRINYNGFEHMLDVAGDTIEDFADAHDHGQLGISNSKVKEVPIAEPKVGRKFKDE